MDLVLYDVDKDYESSVLEVTVKKVMTECQDKENEYNKINAMAFSLTSKFDGSPDCKVLLDQMVELNKKIADLTPKPPPDTQFFNPSEQDDLGPRDLPVPKRKEFGGSKEVKAEAKRLFRKLSKITHPDATNDKHLTPLFTVIKDAYDRLDIRSLYNLQSTVQEYLEVKKSNRKRKSLLRKNLDNAKRRLGQVLRMLEQQETALGGSLLRCVAAAGEDAAKEMYKESLGAHVRNLQAQYEFMVREKAQVQKRFSFFSYGDSSTTTSWTTSGA